GRKTRRPPFVICHSVTSVSGNRAVLSKTPGGTGRNRRNLGPEGASGSGAGSGTGAGRGGGGGRAAGAGGDAVVRQPAAANRSAVRSSGRRKRPGEQSRDMAEEKGGAR